MNFTVTITTCNRAASLARTLGAVRYQDYDPSSFQVIVADNGSTDKTKTVCDEAASWFKDFTYIYDARPGQLVGWHQALSEPLEILPDSSTMMSVRGRPGWRRLLMPLETIESASPPGRSGWFMMCRRRIGSET